MHLQPICLALTIVNSKMISGELLGPADLLEAQTLYIHETTKIIMIGEYKHLVLATF